MLIRESYKKHDNKHKLAGDISQLLKRFVRSILNDKKAVSLTGKNWINYLNSQVETEVFNEFDVTDIGTS